MVPGYGNSGSEHWQSRWQRELAGAMRVEQRDWLRPVAAEWIGTLEASVAAARPGCVLVAHSLGALLVALWAGGSVNANRVSAALLVAPPDPDSAAFPREIVGFGRVAEGRLPFASLVVASSDDPYGTLEYAGGVARSWGSGFATIGAAGHINSDSRLGNWVVGRRMLRDLAGV